MDPESTLGKRKERTDDYAHGSTLFVSNLPYTATSTDLQTLFSDLAPVRSAFVVTAPGTGVSKGVGYVAFAIKEDAQAAFTKIGEEGLQVAGRSLRVQWADKKTKPDGEEPKKTEKRPREPVTRHSKPTATPNDPLAIRTIVVSGLPTGLDSKTLWKKVRKSEGAESVEYPLKSADGSEDATTAHVLFSTPAHAQDAVAKLHAHVYKGALLSVALKKRLDTTVSATPAKAKASAKAMGATPNRASRLIVRNLPFGVDEQDLRAVFLPHGPIHSVHIPLQVQPEHDGEGKEKEEKKEKRQRGFAFVWMMSRKDAEKAIAECNGMRMRAGMARELVEDKQKRKKEQRVERKRRAQEEQEGEGEGEEEGEEEKRWRTIAVDWALSKEKWEEEKAKMGEDESAESGEGSEDEDEDSSDDSHVGLHDDSGSEEEEGSEGEEGEEPVKPQLPATDVGTTLFVRNVPYEATEDELRTLFRAFGPLRYARITADHETGRGRGTGFACFWNREDADKAVAQSELLRAESGGLAEAPKRNPFKLPSILTPDPSAGLARSLVLHGRTLDVVRAVTRDQAGKLKEDGERAREKADKRNMYLLREGIIMHNTPAAAGMPLSELEKRTGAYNARRQLLNTNPALYVSRTRLSVRQLPVSVTDRGLKRLAIHAARAFEAEAAAGARKPLSADELAEPVEEGEEGGAEKGGGKKGGKGKKGWEKKGRATAVRQAKVVMQTDRVDAVTGKGRSKGYGFVEMHTHADALRVLRWANNNPAVGPLLAEWWAAELEELLKAEETKKEGRDETRVKRMREELERVRGGEGKRAKGALIVEFSIENVQVVQRRAARQKEDVAAPEHRKPRERLALAKKEEEEGGVRRSDKKRKRPGKAAGEDADADARPTRRTKSKEGVDGHASLDGEAKAGQHIGSLIGRKRKKRKSAA